MRMYIYTQSEHLRMFDVRQLSYRYYYIFILYKSTIIEVEFSSRSYFLVSIVISFIGHKEQ